MTTTAVRRDVARFADDHLHTATESRLLVMLYERLSIDLARAESALLREDIETSHACLVHAQAIVFELRSALDVDAWEGGPNMAAIYAWLHGELVAANVTKDGSRVSDSRKIVDTLRDAWREAAVLAAMESAGSADLVG